MFFASSSLDWLTFRSSALNDKKLDSSQTALLVLQNVTLSVVNIDDNVYDKRATETEKMERKWRDRAPAEIST